MLDSTSVERESVSLPFTGPAVPRLPRVAIAVVAAAYAALTVAVVVGSPLDAVDRAAASMRLAQHWPDVQSWVLRYEIIGQRGPSAAVAGAYVVWLSWRTRSLRPVVMLTTSLLLLNLSVGAVKVFIGRLGPLLTTQPRAVFDGGDIFPSGHTSNAVVVMGVLAMLALRHRRLATWAAALGAATVGLGTIVLDTHWVTDVLGGWLAGALILLVLPTASAYLERLIAGAGRRQAWRGAAGAAGPPYPYERTSAAGSIDGRRADHPGAGVNHDGLARRDAAGRR